MTMTARCRGQVGVNALNIATVTVGAGRDLESENSGCAGDGDSNWHKIGEMI
jgi:hypothetical protein